MLDGSQVKTSISFLKINGNIPLDSKHVARVNTGTRSTTCPIMKNSIRRKNGIRRIAEEETLDQGF